MDSYTEQIVRFKYAKRNDVVAALGFTFIFWGVFFLCFINGGWGLTIILIGFIIKSYSKKPQVMEYEYLFVNGDCDISRIRNQSSRKEVYSFRDGDVKRILPYASEKGKNEIDIRDKNEVKNFTSKKTDNSDNWYVFLVDNKKGAEVVIMELDENNVEHCKEKYKKRFEA